VKAVTVVCPVGRDAGNLVEFIDVSEDHVACIIRVDILRVARASNMLMPTDETAQRHNP
jgi:hypothetical protein